MEATPSNFRTAGWFAVLSAAAGIPVFVLQIVLGGQEQPGADIAALVLSLFSLALFIYLLYALRVLLHARFNFHGVDLMVQLLVGAGVLVTAVGALPGSAYESTGAVIAATGCIMVFGACMIVFGIRLLKLDGDLYGLLKPYCYVYIATGVCLALPVLLMLGLLTGVASDVLLAMIFFRAAKA